MKDADKNRDQDKAVARAKGDARCALRKLGKLESLAGWYRADIDPLGSQPIADRKATLYLRSLCQALDIREGTR